MYINTHILQLIPFGVFFFRLLIPRHLDNIICYGHSSRACAWYETISAIARHFPRQCASYTMGLSYVRDNRHITLHNLVLCLHLPQIPPCALATLLCSRWHSVPASMCYNVNNIVKCARHTFAMQSKWLCSWRYWVSKPSKYILNLLTNAIEGWGCTGVKRCWVCGWRETSPLNTFDHSDGIMEKTIVQPAKWWQEDRSQRCVEDPDPPVFNDETVVPLPYHEVRITIVWLNNNKCIHAYISILQNMVGTVSAYS